MKAVRIGSSKVGGAVALALASALVVSSVAFAAPVGGIVPGTPTWEAETAGSQHLGGVSHASTSTAWAVGATGQILQTTDGGANWAPQVSGVATGLKAVCATSESAAIAVGNAGVILQTDDGGETWTPRASTVAHDLMAVDFGSATVGVAVGNNGVIVRTADGGLNWSPVTSPTSQPLYGVAMADAQCGWAVGTGGTILRTVNGGASWDAGQSLSGDVDLYAVSALDRTTAWAAGDQGRIVMTTDGGRTWAFANTGVLPTLLSIDFTNRNLGWATGQTGTMLRTVDGGRSWSTVSPATEVNLQSVDFSADGTAGSAVGASGTVTRAEFTPVPGVVKRVAGADRFSTAAVMARRGWDSANTKKWVNVNHVIIVNGESGREADLLSAVGLAGAYDAPILPITGRGVPASTKTLITEIAARRQIEGKKLYIHIVGGTAAVPDQRWAEIRRIPGVYGYRDQLAGADRYATSAVIAKRVVTLKGASDVQGAILVAADNPAAYYDALAASPIAYGNVMPMLAVRKGAIPSTTRSVLNGALAGKPVYAASSATYMAVVPPKTERLTTSSNRYTAAADIAKKAIAKKWLSATNTGVAASLTDALPGGAFLGERGGVLLYTTPTTAMHSTAAAFIRERGAGIDSGWVLGGTASVPAAQESAFRAQVD